MDDLAFAFLAACMTLAACGGLFSATVVVASKDSRHPERADFACDGRDDQVEVQQALDALPDAGGNVQLLEGTYELSGCVEIPRDRVTLRGVGRSTVLRHAPTDWIKLAADARQGERSIEVTQPSRFLPGQLIGITDDLINPRVADDAVYAYYNNYYIKSLLHRIEAVDGSSLVLDRELDQDAIAAENARIAPCWVMVKAYGRQGVELRDFEIDCNRDHVARVYATYSTFDPPEGYPDAPAPPPPSIFPHVRHGEEILSAVYMENAHHARCHGLYVRDVPSSGLFFVQCDHALIEGNTIIGIGLKGYCNVFGRKCRILGNEIADSIYEDGINVYDVPASVAVVANNIVRNCRRGCILINQSHKAVVTGNHVRGDDTTDDLGVGIGVTSRDGVITGNFVERAGTAITSHALGDFWGIERQNYPINISGNTIRDCYTGVRVRYAHHTSIVANAISDVLGRAAVISVGDSAADGLLIANNQFMNGRPANRAAVWLSGANHLVHGNQFNGFDEGVRLESTAANCQVEANGFVEVGEGVVRVRGAAEDLPA
ncbi:MAG: hypothetical protein CMJ18_04255 [Phycisphaeraceae bacterium]|nr:hypothetical protein [Phycisphaeraceae bacterium]